MSLTNTRTRFRLIEADAAIDEAEPPLVGGGGLEFLNAHAKPPRAREAADGQLNIEQVWHSFTVDGKPLAVLDDISLIVEPGEFLCIVGGSGCGKSTLLRLIAGLETPCAGRISLGSRAISGPGVDRGMVFQEPRLLPWLSVWDNVAFGLRAGLSKSEGQRLVAEHIELVGLSGFERAYPSQLSGGMAQRAGIARALVNRPQVLLLDEPFGALDALTRLQMQREVERIRKAERSTMILVTHDIDEAITLGDRVAVLGGRPGTLRKVFDVPVDRPRDRGTTGFGTLRRAVGDAIFEDRGLASHACSC